MSDALRHYGTAVPPTPSERFTLGDLSFTLEDGALRHVRLGKAEMLRGIAFLVRDRDWGTLAPTLAEAERKITDDSITLRFAARYSSGGAVLDADWTIEAHPDGLDVTATAQASPETSAPFETNRTGFTVLHPAHLAGAPVEVTHSDGSLDRAAFPQLIDPWQPFKDITALTHDQGMLRVTCAFEGDTFEMEDQRQWGDASYKTYVRPLALPWPYMIEPSAPLAQAVRLRWATHSAAQVQAPAKAPVRAPVQPADTPQTFPETALLINAADARRLAATPEDIAAVQPQRLLCHFDTALGAVAAQAEALAALQTALPGVTFDLELICRFGTPPLEELTAVAQALSRAGFRPASVMTCPSVDRQSTPPGSGWPDCPPLEEVHAAAAKAFPNLSRGGGMASFFPELNRKRPPVGMLEFVSHSLCPIVHAADDLSVMETLEAVPHITRSARAIIGPRGYRIGPSTIAMRQNPYGSRTIPNPERARVCMTDDDPRHGAAFGAAYALGLATSFAPAGVKVWTPAEVYGPRGLRGPLVQALAALAQHASAPVHMAEISDGVARLQLGETLFETNLTPEIRAGLGPYSWRQGTQ